MKRHVLPVFCVALVLTGKLVSEADAQSARAKAHTEAARALAYEPGQDFTGAFDAVCVAPAVVPATVPTRKFPRPTPPRAQWYAEPVKVFDNVYFVGTRGANTWAVTTSQGIILLDSNEDYAVEAAVVEGLKKMRLDPATIRYAVITSPHTASVGGARYLQDHFKTRILLSEADWGTLAKAALPPEMKPRKDMVVTDGQKLTLGDTTVTLYVMPGHTPGTVSMVVPVRDGNQGHVAAMLGGRSPADDEDGVRYFPTRAEGIRTWRESLTRFRDITAKSGVDVFLATRGVNEHTADKLNALRFRTAGRPHPFVNKDAFRRYLTMLIECMDAEVTWGS
jgi:metallo-beta-lactamase class B